MTTTLMKPISDVEADAAPREYRWTADDFDRACDAGVFGPEARLELIHGRIIDRMGQAPFHSSLAAMIADALRAVVTPGLTVREERAIRIAFDEEPVPDVSVVTGTNRDYLGRHPTPEEAFLLVELAVSSVANDLGEKALLYAQAGITDYWVALPETSEIMAHREPTPDGYKAVTRLGVKATVSPLAATDVTLPVCDLLGASG